MVYNWKIHNLLRNKSTGIVNQVTYECDVKKGSLYDRRVGEIVLTGSLDSEDFIEYDSLSQSDVLGWLDLKIDKNSIETSLSESIRRDEISFSASIEIKSGVPWSE